MNQSFVTAIISLSVCLAAGAESLSKDEASAVVARLWQSHCTATQAVDYSLPALLPLSEADSVSWHIPDSLEPDAQLTFIFGTKGEKPASGWPLYIYLHGSGPKDHEWANGKKFASTWPDSPSAYFVPRIPNEGKYYRWWQKSKQWVWNRLLRMVLANPDIDPTRIYLTGISEGGYGSQRLASFYADYLAAAGPMAGGEPLVNAPAENCRNIAFSFLTGADDDGFYRNLLTSRTSEAFDSLASIYPGDFTHRIELIPDCGHTIDYTLTTPWLSTHRRNPMPLTVSWEDFEMDTCHRSAFYNIEPLGERNGRRRYDMSIDSATNTLVIDIADVAYTPVEIDPNWGIILHSRRDYTTASSGSVRIYLSDDIINLDRPVNIVVNGASKGAVSIPRREDAVSRSIDLFGDPCRVFTAYIDLEF